MTSESQRLRVAIIGAGIGGLTFALALKDSPNFDVDIYEAAHDISEIGAGVGLWPRGWQILKDLGQEDALNNLLDKPYNQDKPGLVFRTIKANQSQGVHFGDCIMPGANIPLHRADLQHVLLQSISTSRSTKVHLQRRLIEYSEASDGTVKLTFNDGSEASCNILVGADGLKSAVRRTMAKLSPGIPADPFWSGTTVYRALVSSECLSKQMPNHTALKRSVMYTGKDKHLIVFPISHGTLINVVVFKSQPAFEGTQIDKPMVSESTREECMAEFSSWDEEVKVLIGATENVSKWYLHAIKPLATYVSGNVALLGDAAHAMTPHCGAGAGQAIEDAYILARILRSPNFDLTKITRALKIYDEVRQPMGNFVQSKSREQGLVYELNSEEMMDIKDAGENIDSAKLDDWFRLIDEGFRWTLHKELVDDQKRKVDMKISASL